MSRLHCFLLIFFIGFVGSCRADIIAELQARIQKVDDAIASAEDAWIKASSQIMFLKALAASSDPSSKETQDALKAEAEGEKQIASFDNILDNLHAKRLELSWLIGSYKKANDAKQLELVTAQKINDYKTAYVGQVGAMVKQLKIVEDGLVSLQATIADSDISDTKMVAAADVKGKVQGALTGVENSISGLADIDSKIGSDLPAVTKISQQLGDDFTAWWKQQQNWALSTREAIAARKDALSKLSEQLVQKQKEYEVQLAKKNELDAAAAEVRAKKADALALFRSLIEARAKMIQQMSDLAGVVASTLGTVDQAIVAATRDDSLGGILAQSQATTNNMIDIGEFQRIFGVSENALAVATEQMKGLFDDAELVEFKKSITEQGKWVQGFAATLQALRDQSANVRKKLEDKKVSLAQVTAESAKKTASEYAASVQQLIQIITQIRNEASGVIKDVLTPLVFGVSQKIVGLSTAFDQTAASEDSLKALKTSLDDLAGDSNQVDASLKEFNLWAKMLSEYGAMIEQQIADATLKGVLKGIQKEFADWKIWVDAVTSRQTAITKTVEIAKTKYTSLVDSVKVSKDLNYSLDLSIKQSVALLDALEKQGADVFANYQKANTAYAALTSPQDSDVLLDQMKTLITSVTTFESDAKKAQDNVNDVVSTLGKSSTPKSVVDQNSAQVNQVKDRLSKVLASVQQVRTDTNTLKDKAVEKKTSLVAAVTAQKDEEAKAAEKKQQDERATVDVATKVQQGAEVKIDEKKKQDDAVVATASAVTASATSASSVNSAVASTAATAVTVLGAVAVTTLATSVKKLTDDLVTLKKDALAFAGRFDGIKTDDDFSAVSKDFTAAKDRFKSCSDTVKNLLAEADKSQAAMDQDKAANRNISNETTQGLQDQRTALTQAQKDIAEITTAMDTAGKAFDKLSVDFEKKTAASSGIKAQMVVLGQKIQAFGTYLEKIKTAISKGQDTLANGKAASEFDVAVAGLSDAAKLKDTLANEKSTHVMPEFDKLTKTLVPDFIKSFGAVPAALASDIEKQTTWLGAVDSSIGNFMDTIAALNAQLATKRDQLAQDTLKLLENMTFANQLKTLEEAVPNITQSAHIESFMRQFTYVFERRYGVKPEDKNPDVIVGNKARLLRLIDWILKNSRFNAKKSVLNDYRKQVVG